MVWEEEGQLEGMLKDDRLASYLSLIYQKVLFLLAFTHRPFLYVCRVQLKCDGTRRRTGGEVKGKLANGVGSQYSSHYLGTWCIQHYNR